MWCSVVMHRCHVAQGTQPHVRKPQQVMGGTPAAACSMPVAFASELVAMYGHVAQMTSATSQKEHLRCFAVKLSAASEPPTQRAACRAENPYYKRNAPVK